MSEERFKIIFRGDIADGFDRNDVRAKLIDLFGIKEQTVDTLLAGKTAALKKNLDRDGALKFKQAFEQTGAICYIRPMEDAAATTAPKPPSTPITPKTTPGAATVDRSEPESFTVADVSKKPVEEQEEEEPVFEIPAGPAPGTMTCPKCEFIQPSADFCEACGVVVLKYLKRQWEEEKLVKQLEDAQREAASEKESTTPEETQDAVTEAKPDAPKATEPPAPVDRSEPDTFVVVDTTENAKSTEQEPEEEPEPVFEIPAGPSPGTMTCPKCEFVQPTADFCEACGVVILKYLKRQWEDEKLAKQLEETILKDSEPEKTETSDESQTQKPVSEIMKPASSTDDPQAEPEGFTILDDTAEDTPTVTATPVQEGPSSTSIEIPPGPHPGTMRCPKCEFVQPLADCCDACGIVVLKYLQRQAADREQASSSSASEGESDKESDLASLQAIFETPVEANLPTQPTHSGTTHDFQNTFKRSLDLIRENASGLLFVWAGALIASFILSHYHPVLSQTLPVPFAFIVTSVVFVIISSITINTSIHLFIDDYIAPRPALALGIMRLPGFMWMSFWYGLTLAGATMAFVVPGYLFARWFSLAPCCFSAEQTGGLSSLLRSRAYCVGREKTIIRSLLPAMVIALTAILLLIFAPGSLKLLSLLSLPLVLANLVTVYRDAAATRPILSYEDTLAQKIQWPAMACGCILIFFITLLLVFDSGRIRSAGNALLLQAGVISPVQQFEGDSTEPATTRAAESGVFELELIGYRAFVYLNGKSIQEHPAGVIERRKSTSPVTFKPGRNILAIRYEALEGAPVTEMSFRVFKWNVKELKDDNYGKWRIDNKQGLRRFEFIVSD